MTQQRCTQPPSGKAAMATMRNRAALIVLEAKRLVLRAHVNEGPLHVTRVCTEAFAGYISAKNKRANASARRPGAHCDSTQGQASRSDRVHARHGLEAAATRPSALHRRVEGRPAPQPPLSTAASSQIARPQNGGLTPPRTPKKEIARQRGNFVQ